MSKLSEELKKIEWKSEKVKIQNISNEQILFMKIKLQIAKWKNWEACTASHQVSGNMDNYPQKGKRSGCQ